MLVDDVVARMGAADVRLIDRSNSCASSAQLMDDGREACVSVFADSLKAGDMSDCQQMADDVFLLLEFLCL